MEKIKVSNFLTLEDVELEIKPINIVIGEQAQGKSVLAKLIYFCKSFWMYYRDSILISKSESEFKLQLEKSFTEIFPKYTWKEDNFTIQYEINNYSIEIKNTYIDGKDLKSIEKEYNDLKFQYSDSLSKIRENIVQKFKQKSNKLYLDKKIIVTSDESIEESFGSRRYLIHFIEDIIFDLILKPEDIQEETSSFIPSGRSFFSSIESNIFSILLKDINIDIFIKEFGSLYETFKEYYHIMNFEQESLSNKSIREIVNKIICGNYIRENGEDLIQSKYSNSQRKINVVNASSGQQESLPILVILSALYVIKQRFFLVIEEPEAHLFPEAQKNMVELMSLIFNLTEKRNKLFITTHSPYLLTAFNNHLQAGNVLKAIKDKPPEEAKNLQERLFEIMPQNRILDIEDIGVYSLKNGKIENIIDRENNLIDTNIIDEVSEQFGETFDKLLDLESEVCQWH